MNAGIREQARRKGEESERGDGVGTGCEGRRRAPGQRGRGGLSGRTANMGAMLSD